MRISLDCSQWSDINIKITSSWSESPLTDRLLRHSLGRRFVEVENPNILELITVVIQRLEIELQLLSIIADLPVTLDVELYFLNIHIVNVLIILLVVEIRIVVIKIYIFDPIILEKCKYYKENKI